MRKKIKNSVSNKKIMTWTIKEIHPKINKHLENLTSKMRGDKGSHQGLAHVQQDVPRYAYIFMKKAIIPQAGSGGKGQSTFNSTLMRMTSDFNSN